MLVGLQEYAQMVGCSYQTVRRMCEAGRLPYVTLGNRRKIDPEKAQIALEQAEEVKREQKLAQKKKTPSRRRKVAGESDYLTALKELARNVCASYA